MPFAACCGIHGGSASQTTRDTLLRSVSSGCGDCTDIPLVSVWPPESVQKVVTLEAAQASLPVGIELPPLFSAILVSNVEISEPLFIPDSRPDPLRC
jgi:hypothetical protein